MWRCKPSGDKKQSERNFILFFTTVDACIKHSIFMWVGEQPNMTFKKLRCSMKRTHSTQNMKRTRSRQNMEQYKKISEKLEADLNMKHTETKININRLELQLYCCKALMTRGSVRRARAVPGRIARCRVFLALQVAAGFRF